MEDGRWKMATRCLSILNLRSSILVFDWNTAPHFPARFIHQRLQFLRDGVTVVVIFGFLRRRDAFIQQPRVTPPHHFRHARKIILTLDGFDFEPAIIRAVGPAIFEAHQRRHGERAADVGNIETFDPQRRRGQTKDFASSTRSFCGWMASGKVYGMRSNFSVFFQVVFQIADQVAQARGLSKSCAAAAFFISPSSCSCISRHWPSRKLHAALTCSRYCSRVTLPMHGAVQYFRCA